ncbi:AMP-binding protein [Thauera aromatica]|uniref:Long-chain-fatty-acid--CoA ligase n=1 Tax=Thauera aromatica K172 TaxID=44139 RepID=A0A2R4BSC1_THAAR|nr:AMP-binding protein [Thauera aromatica]AVR90236.1 Long-chain-fatty-acid--CoA ligase [Thauera aromatica K172]
MSPAVDALRRAIAAYGERPALQCGAHTLSYAGVDEAVAQRSAELAGLGAARVALSLDNGIDWVLWELALLFGGRICVPVPGFFSPAQQRHVIDSAGIDTWIGPLPAWLADAGFGERQAGIFQRRPPAAVEVPRGTVKITYTSGTTGQPKGVCLDGEAQLAVAHSVSGLAQACGVQRHLCVLPLATLLENIAGVYAPLLAGACVVLAPLAEIGIHGASGLDPARLLGSLTATCPHSLILLPQLLQVLVGAAERGSALPDSLRFIAVGGGRVAPQLLRRAEALGLPVFEGYGLSECASVVCLNTPQGRRIGSVGLPLPHVRLRLGEDGEILVRGARMLGYLGEAPGAGECQAGGESQASGGWQATGDLGHFEDGFLVVHGRKKHQFITAFGRNVNPEWVEAELAQQPAIAQAWVHGEALAQNVAVLVPRSADCTDAELEAAVRAANAALPDYARAHRWLRAAAPFGAANGLATANGRLRRDALLQHYRAAIAALLSVPADEVRA